MLTKICIIGESENSSSRIFKLFSPFVGSVKNWYKKFVVSKCLETVEVLTIVKTMF